MFVSEIMRCTQTKEETASQALPSTVVFFFFATTVDGLEFSGPRIKRTVKARDKDVSR